MDTWISLHLQYFRASIIPLVLVYCLSPLTAHASFTYVIDNAQAAGFARTYDPKTFAQQQTNGSDTRPPGQYATAFPILGGSLARASVITTYSFDAPTGTLRYHFDSLTQATHDPGAFGGDTNAAAGVSAGFNFTTDQVQNYYYTIVSTSKYVSLNGTGGSDQQTPFSQTGATWFEGNVQIQYDSNSLFDNLSSKFGIGRPGFHSSSGHLSDGHLSDILLPGLTTVQNDRLRFGQGVSVGDGTRMNAMTVDMILSPFAPGTSPLHPVLPNDVLDGTYSYTSAKSGVWFDPAPAPGFDYKMTGGSKFTHINQFPTGFTGPFSVYVGDTLIENYNAGDSVDFTSLAGGGVSEFSIGGIAPFDSSSLGFPLQLSFDTATANFTQTAVPEPTSIAGALITLSIAVCRRSVKHRVGDAGAEL